MKGILPNILRRRSYGQSIFRNLKLLSLGVFVVLFMGVFSYTRAGERTRVYAAVPATLNFQARLLTSSGAIVPDGSYSVEFKLYTASTGGVAAWTETQPSVAVKSGYLSVYLGDVNSLGSLDWSQQYWLTMNVEADGEMDPRIRMTSVPYAFRSGQADTLTDGTSTLAASDFAQLAPTNIQAVNSALAALRINQTGAGLLAQWQGDGGDVFTVSKTGAVTAEDTLTINSGGASIVGGIDNNSGGLTEVGSITGVGTNITADGALTIASGGSSGLTLDSASGTLILAANDTTLQRNAAGTYTVDLNDSANTVLSLTNSGTGVASLNLAEGGLQLAGSTVLTSAGALQNLTGISTTGNVQLNSFSGAAGLLEVDASGYVSVATAGTDFENPLTFDNGLTRTANAVTLGGTLTGLTTLNQNGNNVVFSGSGNIGIGTSPTAAKLHISSTGVGLQVENTSAGGYALASLKADSREYRIGTGGSTEAIFGVQNKFVVFDNTVGAVRLTVDTNGYLGVGTTDPSALLSVGSTSQFQVNASGNVTAVGINNTNGGLTNTGAISGATTITASGNLNLTAGALQTNSVVRLTNGGALQNVTGDNTNGVSFNANTITAGTLPTTRGGTGLSSFTANGVLYASSTSALSQTVGTSGQVMLANGSGVPTFTTLSGDISVDGTGAVTIGSNSVVLGDDTTGAYVATVTVGNGLAISGVGSETATANISLDVSTTGTTSTTSSNSGLELTAAGLSLFRGCSNGEVMEWNGGTSQWNCATDNQGLSDSTIKTNVTSLGSVLDSIKNLDIKEFNFKCNDPLWTSYRFTCDDQTGLLAQDLALTFPELVSLRPDGLNQVDFGRLNFYTLKAVSELAVFIDSNGNAALNNISTGGTQRLSSSGALQNITGLTVVSGGASISGTTTVSGAFSASGGTVNLNANSLLNNTNINTGTSTGTVTIGGGLSPLVINSTNFDVSSGGALSGITGYTQASGNFTINGSGTFGTGSGLVSLNGNTTVTGTRTFTVSGGLTTLSGGATISGGTISLNDGGLLTNTNINTGTSTGTVTIGGGLSSLVINSTNFDVSSGGAVSGVTTLTASGNISTTGVYVNDGLSGVSAGTCSSNNYLGGIRVTGGIITAAGSCNGVGLSDQRLKENVAALDSSIVDRIKNVNTVNFDYKCEDEAFTVMNEHCDEDRQTGVIAQELAEIFPELVYEDEYGYMRVKYDALNIYTLKATSEIAKKLDDIQTVNVNEAVDVASVKTNGTLRIDGSGMLQNINGFNMISGGASVVGGLNNNDGGITNAGDIAGVNVLSGRYIELTQTDTNRDFLKLTKNGQGVFTIFASGALEMRLDSKRAFAVNNAAGQAFFNVDTIGGLVSIGSTIADDKAVLFTLDTVDTEGDPPGTPGASYYNSNLGRFRCFEVDEWRDCLPVGTLNDPIALDRTSWLQPAGDQEFPGTPRILPNLKRAHEFKLRMRITTPGATEAKCRLQYAHEDAGPWKDLAAEGKGELSISEVGTLMTEWTTISEEARDEIIVRVMCTGGDGLNIPVFYGVSMQLR